MVINNLRFIISSHLHVKENKIHADTEFLSDLNADSLDIMEVIMAVEDEFAVEIATQDIAKIKTVGDIIQCVTALTGLV